MSRTWTYSSKRLWPPAPRNASQSPINSTATARDSWKIRLAISGGSPHTRRTSRPMNCRSVCRRCSAEKNRRRRPPRRFELSLHPTQFSRLYSFSSRRFLAPGARTKVRAPTNPWLMAPASCEDRDCPVPLVRGHEQIALRNGQQPFRTIPRFQNLDEFRALTPAP